jgi:CheY-like chemotaxis protein
LTPEQREYLTMVRTSADNLLAIINDILDFSKIEAGRVDLESVAFGLRETTTDALKALGVRARLKGLDLTVEFGPDVPDRVVGDPVRLRQILLNLAGNAVKFTERGEVAIRVRSERADGPVDLHFEVRDTGIGIPPDKMAVIFEPFVQADTSMSRKYGGTGLGLTISSRLVEMMSGRLWAESTVGLGSTFHFTIRLALGAAQKAAVPTASVSPPQLRPLHVLLAEDNPVNQRLVAALLEKQGHRVTVVDTGAAAIAAVERETFDAALMDVQMPEMSGFEATAAIRHRERVTGRRLPIVAMTARAVKGDREACLAAGMDGYLAKPIQAAQLYHALADVVGSAQE